MSTQDGNELTLAERKEIDAYLESYKNNPSNSNKYRIGLRAFIEELISSRSQPIKEQAERDILTRCYVDQGEIYIRLPNVGFIEQYEYIKGLHSTNNSLEEK